MRAIGCIVGRVCAAFACVVATLLGAAGVAQAESFRVTFDPPLSEAAAQGNPDSPKTPQKVTITALDADGRPLRGALIGATLTAPTYGALFGSDVPRAEGRRLLDVELGAPQGTASFEYVMPIRGQYDLALRATPSAAASFEAFTGRRSFVIEERSGELLKVVLVGLVVLLFGTASAFVLVRAHRRNSGSPPRITAQPRQTSVFALGGVVVLIAVGFVAYLVLDAANDARHDRRVAALQGPAQGIDARGTAGPVAVEYHVSRSSGDGIGIQTLVGISGRATDARTGDAIEGAELTLAALDEESGEPAFAATTTAPDGTFAWEQTFWDGVEHEITVSAAEPGSSGRAASAHTTLAVEAMAPPLLRKLLALVLLMLPLVVGIALGALLARRVPRRSRSGRPRLAAPDPTRATGAA